MSFSYDASGLSQDLNRIRLELGDTNADDPLLQDEEIEQIASEFSTFNARIAKCCRLICSKVVRRTDYKAGIVSQSFSKIYDRYLNMALLFESKAVGSPWAGGIDVDEVSENKEDTSVVQAKFTKGMHNYVKSTTET